MTLDYAEQNGRSSNSVATSDSQAKRDLYRQSNDKIIDILEALDAEQRGRLLRGLKEHYADDMKKRNVNKK